MGFINRQIIRLLLSERIVKSINRQARAADDFLYTSDFSCRQDIIGDGEILMEPLGIPGGSAKRHFCVAVSKPVSV